MDLPGVAPPAEHAPPVDQVEEEEEDREDTEEHHVSPGEPLTVPVSLKIVQKFVKYQIFDIHIVRNSSISSNSKNKIPADKNI